ncbi:MAG: hypothetical protein HKP48_09115 [Winogradskyella sp.]|uniref:hypothetical protein n=1 Tax=Winogradskyella sp. TaxID=1883156 RepID=UPI0017D0AE21|nr:hypothetical protein [Winogradskyella sp.]MBT8243823.1 hypothetical protein [Winogradskyella sp.]NNK23431.1 hypothetical protein [Winogradskyella sp.]
MKLTDSQIQQLYTFTQKHFVEYYDVQTELVDHLANGIENQWKNNPKLTFNEALEFEFKKFGICGFSDVIEEKTKALNKHYRLLVWRYFKEFFKLPKIIGTLFLIWSYYQVLIGLNNRYWILIPTAILVLFVPIWAVYKQSRRIKAIKQQTNKKWLFDNISLQLGGMVHFLNIGLQVSFFNYSTIWSHTFSLVFSIGIVLFSLALYVAIWIVSPKLRKTIALQHPDYKFA